MFEDCTVGLVVVGGIEESPCMVDWGWTAARGRSSHRNP